MQVFNHKAAVNHAGFLSDTEVYAISSDEQLSVYTLSAPDEPEDATPPVKHFGDVRELLPCAYVVKIIPPSESGVAWVAAGNTR